MWCQLFSEPGAGSDAAGIRTRATKTDGGWLVNGQKVWTSGAASCNRGFATVRTDPDKPKHDGITMMVIDLEAPGVDIRPLREASGGELFCEVFFDDVFVPDDDVVGPVDGGWKVARSTLGNERVSIGSGSGVGEGGFDLLDIVHRYAPGDSAALEAVGRLLAERRAMHLLNLRSAERAVAGAEPGPEGNVAKLLSGEHLQAQAALALRLLGPVGALADGPDAGVQATEVFARCLTIAGGTRRSSAARSANGCSGSPATRCCDDGNTGAGQHAVTAPVLCAVADGVATVTLNRPERMNAWTHAMEVAYFDLVDALDDDPDVRAVVLTGAGRGFCPGLDAGDLAARTQGVAGQEGVDRPMTHAQSRGSH